MSPAVQALVEDFIDETRSRALSIDLASDSMLTMPAIASQLAALAAELMGEVLIGATS